MNSVKILDMFLDCFSDVRLLYDFIDSTELWSVTNTMYRASQFSSDRTSIDVALGQWLVKWGTISALCDISIMFLSEEAPTGELQNHTVSYSGLNL